jgi:hypothetical protein
MSALPHPDRSPTGEFAFGRPHRPKRWIHLATATATFGAVLLGGGAFARAQTSVPVYRTMIQAASPAASGVFLARQPAWVLEQTAPAAAWQQAVPQQYEVTPASRGGKAGRRGSRAGRTAAVPGQIVWTVGPTPEAAWTAAPAIPSASSGQAGGSAMGPIVVAQEPTPTPSPTPTTPPEKIGSVEWIEFWQHHPYPGSAGENVFPIEQMNYPTGTGWVLTPCNAPFIPPVWVGTTQPFQPPTNFPGGQIFIGAGAASSDLSSQLAAVGMPISSSGQLVTFGADGSPIFTPDWWILDPQVKNAVAVVLFNANSFPHPMWRTDSYHWGYGNIGVGLPAPGFEPECP